GRRRSPPRRLRNGHLSPLPHPWVRERSSSPLPSGERQGEGSQKKERQPRKREGAHFPLPSGGEGRVRGVKCTRAESPSEGTQGRGSPKGKAANQEWTRTPKLPLSSGRRQGEGSQIEMPTNARMAIVTGAGSGIGRAI